jgi:hypothetical protein
MNRALLSLAVLAACGSRTTPISYPGAPTAFDRSASDPKAVAIAEKVFATAGGPGHWQEAKQLRWDQAITNNGQVVLDADEAWDRWNARHYGRLRRDGGDVVVGYELYGTFTMAYAQQGKHAQTLDPQSRDQALGVARAAFHPDTTVLALQFLMLEPGVTLKYVGPTPEGADDIQVVFADPVRKEYEVHAIVDPKSSLLQRVEMIKAANGQKIGYTLTDWVTVNGMKFASKRTDMGSNAAIAISNLKVSAPDDDLFVMPLAQ